MTIGYVCLLTLLVVNAYGAKEINNQQDADDFLEKYGYLNGLPRGNQRSIARNRAIASFQDFAGLPVTGQLDEATKAKMVAPRCGMTDSKKTTRSALKWKKPALKWALEKSTNQLDSGRIRMAIKQALDVWAKVVPLNFTEVAAGSGADMQFSFGSTDHGCGYHFDGEGGVLAHAFFPSDGRLHFDDQERWAFEDANKIQQGHTDLLSVTIHELGHSLGLPHSKEQDAIMFPYYRAPELVNGKLKQFELSGFDINDIQAIYGPREGATTRAPEVTPPSVPTGNSCPRFQAAVTGTDGATYFFDNSNIGWKKTNAARDPANSAVKFYVDQRFPGAPSGGITAALTDKRDQLTFLFQGRRVHAYSYESGSQRFVKENGYPKDLKNDVPFTPDGAFQLSMGHLILFQGDQFVIWDAATNSASFKGSVNSYFGLFPPNAKASFAVGEDDIYFVDATNYYVYNGHSKSVTSTKPLKTLITC